MLAEDNLGLLHAIRSKMSVMIDEVPPEAAQVLLDQGWIEQRHGVVFRLVRGQGRIARRGEVFEVSTKGLDFLRGMQ